MSHVPVPPALRVPPQFEAVERLLTLHDPDLRLRRSVEWVERFVLERRCRRAPAVNSSMPDTSDMHIQARDGYIHVATVHPAWLYKPWNLLDELQGEGRDLWVAGGHAKVDDELVYEEQWARETRKRRRLGLYRDIASEGYDTLSRMNIGGERSRFSNPGMPAPVVASGDVTLTSP